MITLSQAQSSLLALLTAAKANAVKFPNLSKIAIVSEGADSADADNNAALSSGGPGVCAAVLKPFSVRTDGSISGVQTFAVTVSVYLEVNPVQNKATDDGGANVDPLSVVEEIWKACCDSNRGRPQNFTISNPLDPIVDVNGALQHSIDFELPMTFKP